MEDQSGKKAELDKDGIAFDFGKAELDKEGMTLTEQKGTAEQAPEGTSEQAPEQAEPGNPSKRRLILYGSIAAGAILLILIGSTVTYQLLKKRPEASVVTVAVKPPPPPPSLDAPDGDLTLEPFMVLFSSNSPKESGVLLAQVSLQVSPETAYNIGSRMFDIRKLIYQRLTANAEVFTKNELAAIIRDDLKFYNVRDVQFVQFERK